MEITRKPTITKQFKRWLELQQKEPRLWGSCDFEVQDIRLLFRNYTNDIGEYCLTIASVYIAEEIQNQGVFKSLLKYVVKKSPRQVIAIEDINNPILQNFCIKYDFKPISSRYSNSFHINKDELCQFQVDKFQY